MSPTQQKVHSLLADTAAVLGFGMLLGIIIITYLAAA